MTLEDRWNIQHGSPEKINRPYNSENALDRYILARISRNRIIIDEHDYNYFIEAAGTDIANTTAKILNDTFKMF